KSLERGDVRWSERGGDQLGLQVLLETGGAHLAPDAGLLVAAEGHVGAVPDAAVHAECAGADAVGDRGDALAVGAVDGTGQAVLRVVGDGHGLVVGVVTDDHQDRAEDLLTGHGRAGVHPGDQGGFDEIAALAVGRAAAAGDDPTALGAGDVDVALHPVTLAGRDERTADGALAGRIARPDPAHGGGGDLHGLVVAAVGNQQ